MCAVETRTIDLGGPLHVADFGGQGPPVVLLHGLGGSHVNWMRLGPMLADRARVMAVDLAGFGRTPPAGRRTTVQANARLVGRFVREVAGAPAVLVGNSMGGMIAILEAAAHPASVAGLVLIDPALPMAPGVPRDRQISLAFTAYMTPGIGEVFVRRRRRTLGSEGLVRETFRLCCVDPSRVPEGVIRAHVDMVEARARMPWADRAVLAAARSLVPLVLRRRHYGALLRRVRAPTLLIQGMEDRFVQVAAALLVSKAHPDWTFRPMRGLGHTPHLEDPEATAAAIWEWVDGPGAEAWESANRAARPARAG
jgi:pimeloyl-ACP methyl ester carboxylesterase